MKINPLPWIAKKTLLNWNRPFYSKQLFIFCSRYVDMWYGDNNYDRNTNGEYRLLSWLIPRSKVAVDVGANTGEYSSTMLALNSEIKIHAFEPNPKSFEKLKKIPLAANNLALGEKEETRLLSQMDHSTHNSFYSTNANKKSIPVKVETLDSYAKNAHLSHIDFLKIDVEGHEFFVLKGASELLKQGTIDYIQFEFSGGTRDSRVFLKDFMDLFEKNGYTLNRIRAKDVQPVVYRPDAERFTLTNYLAIKNGLPVPNL